MVFCLLKSCPWYLILLEALLPRQIVVLFVGLLPTTSSKYSLDCQHRLHLHRHAFFRQLPCLLQDCYVTMFQATIDAISWLVTNSCAASFLGHSLGPLLGLALATPVFATVTRTVATANTNAYVSTTSTSGTQDISSFSSRDGNMRKRKVFCPSKRI